MNINAMCYVQITELTDCGCLPLNTITYSDKVHVVMTGKPAYGQKSSPPPNEHLSYDVVTSYLLDLSIGGVPAANIPVPDTCKIDLWAPTTDDRGTTSYGHILIRLLRNGHEAIPWHECPEHPRDPEELDDDIMMRVQGPGSSTPPPPTENP